MKKYNGEELHAIVREVNLYDSSLREFDVYDSWGLEEIYKHESVVDIMTIASRSKFDPTCMYHRFNESFEEVHSISEEDFLNELELNNDKIVKRALEIGIDIEETLKYYL